MAGKGDKAEMEQLLSSYIDGECSQAERDRVQEALRHDPGFRALYIQLQRTIDASGAMPSEASPGHVRERILSQLERRALLGAASIAAAPPARREPSRGRPTAWLGLLAAAMLVAGVGATWWIRMHQERAPLQIAMAPSQRSGGYPNIVREIAPQGANERMRGSTGLDRATDEAGRPYGSAVAQSEQVPSSPLARPSPPVARAQPSAPPQGAAPAGAPPEAPMAADRAVHDMVRSEPAARPALDHALAMRERAGQVEAGKPEVAQRLGATAAEVTAAAPSAPAAPPSGASRSRGSGDLPAGEAAPGTAMSASAARRQAVVAPTAGVPTVALDRIASAGSAGLYGVGGKLKEGTEPAVTQYQVSVRDVGRQMVLTSDVIRMQVHGQRVSPEDPSLIVAAEPTAWVAGLTATIQRAPGVVRVRSDVLPASDPLARQAFSLAWLHAARQLVEWAASGEPLTSTLQTSDVTYQFQNVPPVIPRDYVPLVIVLQPVSPAASEPADQ